MEPNDRSLKELRYVTWEEVYARVEAIKRFHPGMKFWGVPRGGQIIAGLTGRAVDDAAKCDIIVDDITETGDTYRYYKTKHEKPFISAFNKSDFDGAPWVVFPWEQAEPLEREFEKTKIRLAEMLNVKEIDRAIKAIDDAIRALNED
jgi:hypothetical protein